MKTFKIVSKDDSLGTIFFTGNGIEVAEEWRRNYADNTASLNSIIVDESGKEYEVLSEDLPRLERRFDLD